MLLKEHTANGLISVQLTMCAYCTKFQCIHSRLLQLNYIYWNLEWKAFTFDCSIEFKQCCVFDSIVSCIFLYIFFQTRQANCIVYTMSLAITYIGLLFPLLARELPILISAPSSLEEQQSPLLVMMTWSTLYVLNRSTLHHGLRSIEVCEQEPWCPWLSWLLSMALEASPMPVNGLLIMADCVAFP